MIIHVPTKGAFKEERTGVENYIRELLVVWAEKEFDDLNFVLYYRSEPDDDVLWQRLQSNDSFILKKVSLPYLWTQVGLSYELAKSRYTNRTNKHEIDKNDYTNNTNRTNFHEFDNTDNHRLPRMKEEEGIPPLSSPPFKKGGEIEGGEPSVLFVPAHVLPIFCGVPAVVTIHGLEYEHYPECYPLWHRLYLKWMTRLSCFRAKKIIAVSEATKKDLMRFYDVPEDKINVVHHGADAPMDTDERAEKIQPSPISTDGETKLVDENYILYLGRVETKKNILNIIKAFKALKNAEQTRGQSQNIAEQGGGARNKHPDPTAEPHRVHGTAEQSSGYGASKTKDHETNRESRNNTDSHKSPQINISELAPKPRGSGSSVSEQSERSSALPRTQRGTGVRYQWGNKEHGTNTKSKDDTDSHRLPQKVRGNQRKSASKVLSPRESASIYRDLKLVLAGGEGYGYGKIQEAIDNLPLTLELRGVQGKANYKKDIVETGYVSEVEKWRLLRNAKVFCFATLYEGFGMPILEAQKMGTPVIVGDKGAGPEVGADAVLKADPEEPEEIARAMGRLLEDEDLRGKLVEKGYANVGRFSWEECASETLEIIREIC